MQTFVLKSGIMLRVEFQMGFFSETVDYPQGTPSAKLEADFATWLRRSWFEVARFYQDKKGVPGACLRVDGELHLIAPGRI
jgi:hypothetical protein